MTARTPLCRREHSSCVPGALVPFGHTADHGGVRSHDHVRRPMAIGLTAVTALIVVIGFHAATGAATGDDTARQGIALTQPSGDVGADIGAANGAEPTTPTATVPTTEPTTVEPSATSVAPTTTEPDVTALSRPVVVLYGDSLAWEARDSFTQALAAHPDLQVVTRTFGGTAICDWLATMSDDAASLAPGMVVVEFSGNSFTPCMQGEDGLPLDATTVTDRYRADAATVVATFAPIGTQVVFAGAPTSGPSANAVGRLNALYEELANEHQGVGYVDAGAAVLADDSYTLTLPCLSSEPCGDGYNSDGVAVNVVRAADGVHFCPVSGQAVQGVTEDCPVWSSGAYRYGIALAEPVVDAANAG